MSWLWCCGGESSGRGKKPQEKEHEIGNRVHGSNIEWCPFMFDEGNGILRRMRDPNPTSTLRTVSFTYLKVGDEAVEWIVKTLFLNSRLERLHLQHNIITGDGAVVIARELSRNPSISELHLGHNSVDELGIHALGDMLRQNTNLTTLWLNNNRFRNDAAEALASAVRHNSVLRDLDLASNGSGVGDKSAVEFANSLLVNTSLTRLDLYGGGITDDGVSSLAEMLCQNTVLTNLNLGHQRREDDPENPSVGDRSAEGLGAALRANTVLRSLQLVDNGFGDLSAEQFAAALKENKTLTVLNLGMCRLGVDGMRILHKFVSSDEQRCLGVLKHLNLYENPGGKEYFHQVWTQELGRGYTEPPPDVGG
eukprot:TRINITY_DN20688_c1_g2_i1.p1 TRINITY_DN20688_c1_g2~~TRINITY_DN20688_c1_g2_i1.p1  ORF type:complete len:390 (+),score=144.43 TRINITY_DN20688_c1_g2_i1:78-1172(+)